MNMPPQEMLIAALGYATHGWPVFPCHPQTKRPLLKGDIDPATEAEIPNTGGLKKASTNPETIRNWWQHWPKALIGVPTGRPIGAFVLDLDAGVDEKTGEIFELAALERAIAQEFGAPLPSTWSAETPRGGRHLYFALPDGEVPGNRAGLIKRVDVRGDGGYVIVPPSSRPDGKSYRWVTAPW
jgi:putative DNA primase/helicase